MIIAKERFELLISDLDRLKTDLTHVAEMLSGLLSIRDLSRELVDELSAMTSTLMNETTTSRREQFEGHDPDELLFDPDSAGCMGEQP